MPRTPQFASTPRFVLSQRAPPSSFATHPRAESIGDDSPQNTPLAKRERARPAVRDVIEDSEHDSGLSDAEVDSEFEAEYEALFGETERSKTKRRRVDGQNRDENVINEDNRNDSDTQHCEHTARINDNIINTNHDNDNDNDNDNNPTQEPAHPIEPPSSNEHIPSSPLKPPSTPYPNQHRRRFILGASSQLYTPSHPSSTAPRHPIYTTPSQSMTPAPPDRSIPPLPSSTIPPSSRRKPAFVLPRSPSPDTALDDVPSLFSPSRTQRRRGRSRASAQGYVAGGMAEQVRGWVLEMGVKGGNSASNPNSSWNGAGSEGQEGQRYAGVLRVCEAEGSAMGSCGRLVFVRGVEVSQERRHDQHEDGGHGEKMNLLLMGVPQSGERDGVPELKKGDLVGIGRGLVWEVELDAGVEPSGEMEKWSVCVEWGVL